MVGAKSRWLLELNAISMICESKHIGAIWYTEMFCHKGKENRGLTYRKVFNIRRTLVGNKIVDHSDVVGASPVGAAPTSSSFST